MTTKGYPRSSQAGPGVVGRVFQSESDTLRRIGLNVTAAPSFVKHLRSVQIHMIHRTPSLGIRGLKDPSVLPQEVINNSNVVRRTYNLPAECHGGKD